MVKGKYTGSVTLSEKEPPQRFKMQVEGKGTGGFMQGTGLLELSRGSTRDEGDVSGGCSSRRAIASVGQRLIEGAAKMIVGQFFTLWINGSFPWLRRPSPLWLPNLISVTRLVICFLCGDSGSALCGRCRVFSNGGGQQYHS